MKTIDLKSAQKEINKLKTGYDNFIEYVGEIDLSPAVKAEVEEAARKSFDAEQKKVLMGCIEEPAAATA